MAKAAKPKKAKNAAPKAGAGGGKSLVWLSGMACGGVAVLLPGLAAMVLALLAPGLVALKLDTEPGRPIARTVLTCGLTGCVHPILTLWNTGPSVDTALAIGTDPATLGIAWSAAAAGWLATQIAPLIVRTILEAAALARATRLKLLRDRIAEAWDLEDAP